MKIKELAPKPSDAIQAMYDGLKKQGRRRNFIVDMSTFGEIFSTNDKTICYGCAATCTIQQIAGKNLTPENIEGPTFRAEALGFDKKELEDFEEATDQVRRGNNHYLLRFYGMDMRKNRDLLGSDIYMDESWKEELPKVAELIVKLKERGL